MQVRRRMKVDAEFVLRLAAIGCTTAEIACHVGCSERTLYRRFDRVIRAGKLWRHASLRRRQTEVAIAGNAQMLIHLGKCELGQGDHHILSSSDSTFNRPQLSFCDRLIAKFPDAAALRQQRAARQAAASGRATGDTMNKQLTISSTVRFTSWEDFHETVDAG